MKTEKLFKTYISSNTHTTSFDHAYSEKGPSYAMAAVKRKNPGWEDLHVWCVQIINGMEFLID